MDGAQTSRCHHLNVIFGFRKRQEADSNKKRNESGPKLSIKTVSLWLSWFTFVYRYLNTYTKYMYQAHCVLTFISYVYGYYLIAYAIRLNNNVKRKCIDYRLNSMIVRCLRPTNVHVVICRASSYFSESVGVMMCEIIDTHWNKQNCLNVSFSSQSYHNALFTDMAKMDDSHLVSCSHPSHLEHP